MSGHLIASSHQTFLPYSVTCTCGRTFEAPTHARLASLYAEHQAGVTGAERAERMRAGIGRTYRSARTTWGVS